MTFRHLREDDLAVVAAMTRDGHTARAIAERLSCTTRTVQRARGILGVAKPKTPIYSKDVWDRVAELIADGCSHKEIERTLGISSSQVGRRFPGTGWTKRQGAEWWGEVRRLTA